MNAPEEVPVHLCHVGRMSTFVAPNGQWCLVIDEADPEALVRNGDAFGRMARAMGAIGAFGVVGSLDVQDADLAPAAVDALVATRPSDEPTGRLFAARLSAMAREVARAQEDILRRAAADGTEPFICPLPQIDGLPFACGCEGAGRIACGAQAAGVGFDAGQAPDVETVEDDIDGMNNLGDPLEDDLDAVTDDDRRAAREMFEDAEDPCADDRDQR